jgi:hypothetical protein
MRKYYIRPEIEEVASQYEQEIMAGHSYDWADAKGNPGVWGGGGQVIENGKMQGKDNLWDD